MEIIAVTTILGLGLISTLFNGALVIYTKGEEVEPKFLFLGSIIGTVLALMIFLSVIF